MYITIVYIVIHIPPTRLRIRTVITPCTHGHFAGNDARVPRPHRSEKLKSNRGSAPDAGMCRQLLEICVIRIPSIVSLLRPGFACTAQSCRVLCGLA
jgi:hypothetical protein